MSAAKKVQRALAKWRCLHCKHRAIRRRRREGTTLDVPLCASQQCLRDEWSLEDEGIK